MKELILIGRVAAVHTDAPVLAEASFSLLLCTRLPDGRRDLSPTALLRMIPPTCLWSRPPGAPGPGHAGEPPMSRAYNLPYDLLVSSAEASLVARGMPPARASSKSLAAEGLEVCNARITYATKGHKGRPELQQHWREEVAALAGQWAEVRVELHRYSFTASRTVRSGTRLVLQSIRPAGESGSLAGAPGWQFYESEGPGAAEPGFVPFGAPPGGLLSGRVALNSKGLSDKSPEG